MLKLGIVTQLDPAGARARVRFPELDADPEKDELGLESYWLQVVHGWTLNTRAFSMPAIGAQVACLMDEHLEFGVILGGVYSEPDPRPAAPDTSVHLEFEDGTVLEYDPAAHLLKADVQGDVNLAATGDLVGQVDGNANLTVGGDLDAQVTGGATVQAATVEVQATTVTIQGSASVGITAPAINLAGVVTIAGSLATAAGTSGTGTATFVAPVTFEDQATFEATINAADISATGVVDAIGGVSKATVPYTHP